MTVKTQKIISAGLNALVIFGGFEILIKILNLNQVGIYLTTAFYVWLFFVLQIIFLYDLHFKTRGAWGRARAHHENTPTKLARAVKILFSAFAGRLEHFISKEFLGQWLNYLLLPGFVFWATICVLFINFGFLKIQQLFVVLSGTAMLLNYWYLKEIFCRKQGKVEADVFVVMSMVKIYASALTFGAALSIIRHYCLPLEYFVLGTFALTFLLIYQALFQHRLVTIKNLFVALLIAFAQAMIAYPVGRFWGYNYFTAAIFLGAFYNFFWGIFHYRLDKALTVKVFFEILIFCGLIAAMVFSVTNFQARILDACQYQSTWSLN